MRHARSMTAPSDQSIDIATAAIGPITFDRCDSVGGRPHRASPSRRAERVQLVLFGAVSHVGSAISPGDRDSGRNVRLHCGAVNVHVFGRGECVRGANIDAAVTGRDVGHQGFGRHK